MIIILKSKNVKMLLVSSLAAAGVLAGGVNASASTNKKVTVHAGDTVSEIAHVYHTTTKKVNKKNHLNDQSLIKVGQKLILPKDAHKDAVAAPAVQNAPVAAQPAQAAKTAQPQTAPVHVAQSAHVSGDAGLGSIASAESGNSYSARNGQYIGKYQLSASYLHGDYSAANQERVARQYAVSRYGSVASASAFHKAHGWW